MMKMTCVAGLAALVLAAPAVAQQRDTAHRPMHGMMQQHQMPMQGMLQGMDEMMGPMMRMMAFTPEHLLSRKDSLGLTAQQEQRLTALRDAAKAAHNAAMAEARTHMAAMGQAADTTSLKQHFQGAHNAMGAAHWAMMGAAMQARAVLTEEQRARVAAWADQMMHMEHR